MTVIEGDQQTTHDADRIRATGARALQINTGKGCHLDASMVERALERLQPADDTVLFIENVGNLVCPAAFDLGEAYKVVVLSVTEGEDKPLKYPDMFRAAAVMLLNKVDLLPYVDFAVDRCIEYARRVNPSIEVMQVSATKGDGMERWIDWIRLHAVIARHAREQQRRSASRAPTHSSSPAEQRWTRSVPVMRRALRVRGQVQGVGFRPFVYRLAHDLALSGRVLNDGAGVEIEIQGPDARLDEFRNRLEREVPRLARIDAVESRATTPRADEPGFVIAASAGGPVSTGVTPDSAPCADCIDEMFDPQDRRWRYAFTNCTNCGPRYTITAALPYDRPNTSMARFSQCPACQREYDDPLDRRFHAQPNACPVCGPRLALLRPDGEPIEVDDPIAATLQRLRARRDRRDQGPRRLPARL